MHDVRVDEYFRQEDKAAISYEEKLKFVSKLVPRNVCLFVFSHFFSYLIGLLEVFFPYFVARAINQALFSETFQEGIFVKRERAKIKPWMQYTFYTGAALGFCFFLRQLTQGMRAAHSVKELRTFVFSKVINAQTTMTS